MFFLHIIVWRKKVDSKELENFLNTNIAYATVEIIGTSVLGSPLYSVSFNFGSKQNIIIQGAIHAREHITCDLIVEMIREISNNYEKYKQLSTPNIVFVPLVNPDGANLVINGIKSVKNPRKRKFLKQINNGSLDFSQFKANINGVDLNSNFDARWGTGKENLFYPSTKGFVGYSPLSEPCTIALASLTERVKPFFTVSYHSKGQEVYYDFYCKKENLRRDKRIAKIVATTLGYKIKSTEKVSSGGYKDWCISRFNIPSVTIEVGSDRLSHPIQKKYLKKIYKRNKKLLYKLGKIAKEYERYARKSKTNEKGTFACKKSV